MPDSKYRCWTARKKAWQEMYEVLPDLVLLDWMMPGLDGPSVIKNMRATEATKGIPAIIVSSRNGTADIQAGIAAGAQKYMVKPFLSDELISEMPAASLKRITGQSARLLRRPPSCIRSEVP